MTSRALRVMHITEALAGGVSTYLRLVLARLAQRGFEVSLACSLNRGCPSAEETLAVLRAAGVAVHVIPMVRPVAPATDGRCLARLYRLLTARRYDVVHTHCSKGGALGRTAAFLAGCRGVVHTPHCFSFLRNRGDYGRRVNLYVERMLGLITVQLVAVSASEGEVAVRQRIVPASRCRVVANGVEERGRCEGIRETGKAAVKRWFDVEGDAMIVSTVCRLAEYKGVGRFLEAARRCTVKGAVFLVAGEGPLRVEAERFIGYHGLGRRVRLLGHVARMETLYGISDVVVLCSVAEGQPYALLEAMRAGCAVAATAVAGNRDVIEHGRTGYLTSSDPADIARAIEMLLGDEERRQRYGAAARQYVAEHHRLEGQVAALANIYEAVAAERGGAYAAG